MTRGAHGFAVLLGAVAIVLAIVNAALFNGNRAAQADDNGRAQFIQQSVQLEGLYNEMVRALAELSARNGDEQLKAVLQGVGITFSVNGAAAAPGAPANPARK
ncbi:MAG: hypothetical protein U1E86_13665 [Burkholderiaceae bacterium]